MTEVRLLAPVIALFLAACVTPPQVPNATTVESETMAAAPMTQGEIPLTTSSLQARTEFAYGERLLDAQRPLQAREHFRRAVELDPNFAYAYLSLANAASSFQEFKENLEHAERHMAQASEGEQLFIKLNRTFVTNDADTRMILAKELTRKYPESPRTWLQLGFVQTGLNRHEAARESYRKAIELDPDFYAAHLALGQSFTFNDPRDLEQARMAVEKAISARPAEAKGYEILGDAYRAANKLEKARDAYSQAVAKDPTLSVATLKKGHINSFLGNYAEARTDYDASIRGAKEANRITFGVYRAFTSVHEGNPTAAVEELRQLAQKAGTIDIPAHQVEGAKTFALTNAATIALHHDHTDMAAKVIGEMSTAMRADAARANEADFTRVQEATILAFESQLAAKRGDYATALQKAEEHKKLMENDRNPRRLETYHALHGLIALEQGKWNEAVAHYRQADLTDVYQKYHLALALQKSGQTDEAQKLFADVASWNFNSVGYALVRKEAKEHAAKTAAM